MKNILVITAQKDWVRVALSLVESGSRIIYCMTLKEIEAVETLEDHNIYDLIVISVIHWKIPKTSKGLVEFYKRKFSGPIIAIGNHAEWCASVEAAGCDHILENDMESAEVIRELLHGKTS